MMGTKIRNFTPLPREVSLEHLVPKDNFYPVASRRRSTSRSSGTSSRTTTLLRAVRASIPWSSSACSW